MRVSRPKEDGHEDPRRRWYAVVDYRPPFASLDAPDAVGLPSLLTALEEQLGLRLVPELAPVPTLVIERISRFTPN